MLARIETTPAHNRQGNYMLHLKGGENLRDVFITEHTSPGRQRKLSAGVCGLKWDVIKIQ